MPTLSKANRKAQRTRREAPAAPAEAGMVTPPAPRRASAATAYGGADRNGRQSVALWRANLASADADFLYERDTIVARARDLVRNDGTAAAGVQRAVDLLVGNRWMLAAKPDGDALGLDPDQTRAIGRQMETCFRRWANDPRKFCDRSRRLNFSGMLTLMARQWVGPEGEAIAVLGFKKRPGALFQTTMQVIDPDRLSNPGGQPNSETIRGGVEFDDDGAPIAAHFRKRHMIDVGFGAGAYVWERVDWETKEGRPIVLHLMEHERAGQTRGVTRFAAILANFKQLAQLTETEIASALLNAMMAAFVKSGGDPAALAAAMTSGDDGYDSAWQTFRAQYYDEVPVKMNGIVLPILLPGDEVELNTAERSTTNYVAIRTAFAQQFAAQLGISYEALSGDLSKVNYSSMRAGENLSWRSVISRRGVIAETVATPAYMAVMEEAFDLELIELPDGAPSFEEMPEAYCRAQWIGPGRGYNDPVKERQASQMGIDAGLTTLEKECAEQGEDWEDIADQRAHEIRQLRARGLTYGMTPEQLALVGPTEAEADFVPVTPQAP